MEGKCRGRKKKDMQTDKIASTIEALQSVLRRIATRNEVIMRIRHVSDETVEALNYFCNVLLNELLADVSIISGPAAKDILQYLVRTCISEMYLRHRTNSEFWKILQLVIVGMLVGSMNQTAEPNLIQVKREKLMAAGLLTLLGSQSVASQGWFSNVLDLVVAKNYHDLFATKFIHFPQKTRDDFVYHYHSPELGSLYFVFQDGRIIPDSVKEYLVEFSESKEKDSFSILNAQLQKEGVPIGVVYYGDNGLAGEKLTQEALSAGLLSTGTFFLKGESMEHVLNILDTANLQDFFINPSECVNTKLTHGPESRFTEFDCKIYVDGKGYSGTLTTETNRMGWPVNTVLTPSGDALDGYKEYVGRLKTVSFKHLPSIDDIRGMTLLDLYRYTNLVEGNLLTDDRLSIFKTSLDSMIQYTREISGKMNERDRSMEKLRSQLRGSVKSETEYFGILMSWCDHVSEISQLMSQYKERYDVFSNAHIKTSPWTIIEEIEDVKSLTRNQWIDMSEGSFGSQIKSLIGMVENLSRLKTDITEYKISTMEIPRREPLMDTHDAVKQVLRYFEDSRRGEVTRRNLLEDLNEAHQTLKQVVAEVNEKYRFLLESGINFDSVYYKDLINGYRKQINEHLTSYNAQKNIESNEGEKEELLFTYLVRLVDVLGEVPDKEDINRRTATIQSILLKTNTTAEQLKDDQYHLVGLAISEVYGIFGVAINDTTEVTIQDIAGLLESTPFFKEAAEYRIKVSPWISLAILIAFIVSIIHSNRRTITAAPETPLVGATGTSLNRASAMEINRKIIEYMMGNKDKLEVDPLILFDMFLFSDKFRSLHQSVTTIVNEDRTTSTFRLRSTEIDDQWTEVKRKNLFVLACMCGLHRHYYSVSGHSILRNIADVMDLLKIYTREVNRKFSLIKEYMKELNTLRICLVLFFRHVHGFKTVPFIPLTVFKMQEPLEQGANLIPTTKIMCVITEKSRIDCINYTVDERYTNVINFTDNHFKASLATMKVEYYTSAFYNTVLNFKEDNEALDFNESYIKKINNLEGGDLESDKPKRQREILPKPAIPRQQKIEKEIPKVTERSIPEVAERSIPKVTERSIPEVAERSIPEVTERNIPEDTSDEKSSDDDSQNIIQEPN